MKILKDDVGKEYYTFGLIKPDGMEHMEEIIKMIQAKGLKFVHWNYIKFTGELIDEHYSHVKEKFPEDYKKLYNFMKDKEILAFILYDEEGNAVKNYRNVLGVTKSWEASPDTIRGRFGDKKKIYKNVAHGSGNIKEAQEEAIRFFKQELFDVFDNITWLKVYEISLGIAWNDEKYNYINEQILDLIVKSNSDDYCKKMEK